MISIRANRRSGQRSLKLVFVVFVAGVETLSGALVENPVRIDKVHVDLAFPYINGHWDIHVHASLAGGSRSLAPNEAILIANPNAVVARSASSAYDFLGVPPGAPLWLMSQNGDVGLYLGFEATYDFQRERRMTLGSVLEWDHDGGGFSPPQRVVEISLVGMRGPGHVSAWFAYPGGPDIFFASSDGISPLEPIEQGDDLDEYPQFVGGHSHVNWAFTAPGFYELDFQARTMLSNGSVAVSEVSTFYFQVEAIPEPSVALVLSGAICLFLSLRRHRSVPGL